jgi:ketosteroid isomerase-like protein
VAQLPLDQELEEVVREPMAAWAADRRDRAELGRMRLPGAQPPLRLPEHHEHRWRLSRDAELGQEVSFGDVATAETVHTCAMATSTDHRSTILRIYEAFGTGDLPAIMERIADEVDWGLDPEAPVVKSVPWAGRVTTKEEVASVYFAGVGSTLQVDAFEPLVVAQDGDHVASVLRSSFTVRATGKQIDALECHFFTFGHDGRIAAYRPILDTAAFISAFS